MNALVLQLAASVAVFGAVVLCVLALFARREAAAPPVHRRIARALGADQPTVFERPLLRPVLDPAVALAGRLELPGLKLRLREDLDGSGNAAGYSVDQFLALCLVIALVAALGGAAVETLLGGGLLLLVVPLFAGLGFYVPMILLHSARQRRVLRIAKQLPYTLDLIALVMQAGSSFTEAVETLIRDHPADDLNQELRVALSEIELGSTRAAALENVSERVPLESLRSVIASVNQAEQLGTPLADILKAQSITLRNVRAVEAEKRSASASLRILVPSMLILIAVVIVVFGPMVVRMLRGELRLG